MNLKVTEIENFKEFTYISKHFNKCILTSKTRDDTVLLFHNFVILLSNHSTIVRLFYQSGRNYDTKQHM